MSSIIIRTFQICLIIQTKLNTYASLFVYEYKFIINRATSTKLMHQTKIIVQTTCF